MFTLTLLSFIWVLFTNCPMPLNISNCIPFEITGIETENSPLFGLGHTLIDTSLCLEFSIPQELTVIPTVEDEGVHKPLDIVHAKICDPVGIPLTIVLGEPGELIVAVPLTKVQIPDPVVGVLAFKVADVAQMVCEGPALEIVGIAETTIAIVEVEAGEQPDVIAHCTMVVPMPNPVIVVEGEFGELIVPLPETTLQVPTPTAGVLPVIVVLPEFTQIVCEGPAFETVGGGFLITQVVAEEMHPGFAIDQRKTFVPIEIKLTVVVG